MFEHIDIQLGRRLRLRRRTVGLTQRQLGAKCGVTFQQIQKYETATNRMSAATIWMLAKALYVDVSYFFDGLSGPSASRANTSAPGRSAENVAASPCSADS